EAPVPVLLVDEEEDGLGGAANVAHNLAALGARVHLAGVVGADESGRRLLAFAGAASITTRAVLTARGRRTTVKSRYVAQGQQILRADREASELLAQAEQDTLIARLEAMRPDAVVISDYAKGVVIGRVAEAVVRMAERWRVPLVVDPKGLDFTRYAGCTVITPNADEASAACGQPVTNDVEAETAGRLLLDAVRAQAVVITRGREGVSLVTGGAVSHLPAHARDVFDVAGAGDTLVAALALALACGATFLQAASLANVAAGLAVQARGVAVVTQQELERALEEMPYTYAPDEERAAA
ncbi:MAG: PfkB family carbohydrate kinase, partial [Dehalococcoidia bacterium]|nr:PfkB family carbohydrate kinase [Dehalococcoidia bacterium]